MSVTDSDIGNIQNNTELLATFKPMLDFALTD